MWYSIYKLSFGGENMIELLKRNESSGEFCKADDLIPDAFENIDLMVSKKKSSMGVKEGFDNVDSITKVLKKKDLMILAGRPGHGKTTFAANLAHNLAMSDLSVAYCHLELSQKQFVSSILCGASGVTDEIIGSGTVDDEKMNQLLNVAKIISDKRLFLEDNSYLTPDVLADKCKKIKHTEGLDVVIIDYLQLMHYGNGKTSFQSRKEEMDSILKELKDLAKDLDITIIALSQVSRDVESKGKIDMFDFRESNGIEQYADTVLFLSR